MFSGDHEEIAFPLGGIGTGNVSLGARGQLTDWEIFNHPGKGVRLPFAFVSIHAQDGTGDSVTRVLESELRPPYTDWNGLPVSTTAALPRLDESRFVGEYPIASVEFTDADLPLDVELEAYTPFVPLDPEDSGLPCAVLEYTLTNPTDRRIEATVAGSLPNVVGELCEPGSGPEDLLTSPALGGNVTEFRTADDATGVHMRSTRYDPGDLRYGDTSLLVMGGDEPTYGSWARGSGIERLRRFWDEFRSDGTLDGTTHDDPTDWGETDIATVGSMAALAPGESRTIRFVLSWSFPTRRHEWDRVFAEDDCCADGDCDDDVPTVRNQYATRFDDSWDVAEHLLSDLDRLRGLTYEFRDALFESTLPGPVLDAVSSQLSTVRSPTCLWLEGDRFLANEGCHPSQGCCPGTCTHVWNYAQSVARIFPSLERRMRRLDLEETTTDDGNIAFRTPLPVTDDPETVTDEPAADGQLGTILRLYREWVYSGDEEFLVDLWPIAARALEFGIETWDPDEDGVITGRQHNTYDVEFYGPNPMIESWYLAALKASAKMATAVDDHDGAERYRALFERGVENADEQLWNGDYYVQRLDDVDEHRHQHGTGCLSDQLVGQWFARVVGLGDVVPPDREMDTLESIYDHNFRESFVTHDIPSRTYAINDESGLVLCSWPDGDQPDVPFSYALEVWTGVEYQVAAHLIYQGLVEEGLSIVEAVRNRHDGHRRNPWNEIECGNHYVRAMSSWSVYDAIAGLSVDLRDGASAVNEHGFRVSPAIPTDEFRCFWITAEQWGTYEQSDGDERIDVLYDATTEHGR